MEEIVKTVSSNLAGVLEIIAVIVIFSGSVIAFFTICRLVFTRTLKNDEDQNIRLRFGKALILGLEFLLAADILETAVAPTWDDIGKVAAIASIRTVLNYFLEKEMKELRIKRQAVFDVPKNV